MGVWIGLLFFVLFLHWDLRHQSASLGGASELPHTCARSFETDPLISAQNGWTETLIGETLRRNLKAAKDQKKNAEKCSSLPVEPACDWMLRDLAPSVRLSAHSKDSFSPK